MDDEQRKLRVQLQCSSFSARISYLPSFLVRLHELGTCISSLQTRLISLPRSHPLRAPCVQALAKARMIRYWKLKDSDDLEQSILHFTETIFLPLPWQGPETL